MLLAVRTSSYGCTWEVWRALKKLELLSAAPRATLTLLSCSPNFPRASITRCSHAKHEPIVKYIYIYTLTWYDDTTYVASSEVAIAANLNSSISTALMRPRRPKQYCLQLDIALWHTKLCFHVQIEHSTWSVPLSLARMRSSLVY